MNEKEYYEYMYMCWINDKKDSVIKFGNEFGEILFKKEEGENNEEK